MYADLVAKPRFSSKLSTRLLGMETEVIRTGSLDFMVQITTLYQG